MTTKSDLAWAHWTYSTYPRRAERWTDVLPDGSKVRRELPEEARRNLDRIFAEQARASKESFSGTSK